MRAELLAIVALMVGCASPDVTPTESDTDTVTDDVNVDDAVLFEPRSLDDPDAVLPLTAGIVVDAELSAERFPLSEPSGYVLWQGRRSRVPLGNTEGCVQLEVPFPAPASTAPPAVEVQGEPVVWTDQGHTYVQEGSLLSGDLVTWEDARLLVPGPITLLDFIPPADTEPLDVGTVLRWEGDPRPGTFLEVYYSAVEDGTEVTYRCIVHDDGFARLPTPGRFSVARVYHARRAVWSDGGKNVAFSTVNGVHGLISTELP